MITALDSSVIWAIVKHEPGQDLVMQTLISAASEGPVVISPIAFAELAPSSPDASSLQDFLGRLDILFDPISAEAAHLAGSTFKLYRQAGGPRQQILPDFIIAAHAKIQANRLAALDKGYFRKWFPDLPILTPPMK